MYNIEGSLLFNVDIFVQMCHKNDTFCVVLKTTLSLQFTNTWHTNRKHVLYLVCSAHLFWCIF